MARLRHPRNQTKLIISGAVPIKTRVRSLPLSLLTYEVCGRCKMTFRRFVRENRLESLRTHISELADPKRMSERYTNEFHTSGCCEKWECLLLGYTTVSPMMQSSMLLPQSR